MNCIANAAKRFSQTIIVLALCILALPKSVMSDELQAYRLVQGDTLTIVYPASDSPISQTVDIDGNIQLIEIGTLAVAGMTLAKAATTIREHMIRSAHYVDPKLDLSISRYASVIVGGDVKAPGKFEYFPGLTVATALALAKGHSSDGFGAYELSLSHVNLSGQIEVLDFEIAAEQERLATLAARSDVDLFAHAKGHENPSGQGKISVALAPLPTDLDAILSVRAWNSEAAAHRKQIDLLQKRSDVQITKTEFAALELVKAEGLKQRGLQTSDGLATLRRREADARSDLLAIESAIAQASVALIQTEARRDLFIAQRKAEISEEMQHAKRNLSNAQLRRGFLQTQLGIVATAHRDTLLHSFVGKTSFEILTLRADHHRLKNVALDTPLLPGDTLLVTSNRFTADQGDG